MSYKAVLDEDAFKAEMEALMRSPLPVLPTSAEAGEELRYMS